jgi:cytochrome c553
MEMIMNKPAAVLLALLFTTLPASAQEAIEEKAMVCSACHGETGVPTQPDVPIIWGQHQGYLYLQLKDYQSGYRKHEVMNGIAADMTREDMMALAEYFSKKEWPRTQYSSEPADEKKGETVAVAGLCSECHLSGFLGDGTIPRAGGQTVTYLEKTLLAFKTRERGNNPDKSNLLSTYSDDDLKAMARYLAGMH